jgi:large subunit ribosomal protein L23
MALHLTQILVRPLITEKNNLAREENNEVVFEVHRDANKPMIKAAVEQLFGVQVFDVRTQQKYGKIRRVGKFAGPRATSKKAFVKLVEGQNIDFFQGA